MPPRTYKKKIYKRRNYKKKSGATTRRPTNFNQKNSLRPSVYPFMRTFEELVVLEDPGITSNFVKTISDNLVVGHMNVSLSQLPAYTEFTSLFKQYKLNALSLKCTPTYQQDVDPTTTETIIIDIWRSSYGVAPTTAFTINDLLQIQKRQTFIMPQRRSFSRNMKLSQLTQVYGSGVTTTDYIKTRPKYISTSEVATPHYGLNFCFRRPDGAAFTSLSPRLLFSYTTKMTMKQVV